MEIIDLLFYKIDPVTNVKRIGKTKTICVLSFIVVFIGSMSMYSTPPLNKFGFGISLIASLCFAFGFIIPLAVIGWIMGKILNSNKPVMSTYNQTPNQHDTFSQNDQNIYQNNYIQESNVINKPENNYDQYDSNRFAKNYAQEFKTSIEENDADNAAKILSNWNKQNDSDANYHYAKIIFEGMPPSDVNINTLNYWFELGNSMNAKDESLKEWFYTVAQQVINMNN